MTGNDHYSDHGTLEVRDHAVERIAEIAAGRVTGVEQVAGTLGTRGLPRAKATVRRGSVSATIDAATRWPTPIADVALRVKAAVETSLGAGNGLDVDSIEVRVHYLSPDHKPGTATKNRRVQ